MPRHWPAMLCLFAGNSLCFYRFCDILPWKNKEGVVVAMPETYADTHLSEILHPIWNSEIVYNECLMLLEEDGVVAGPLLYPPKEILSVRNAQLTETYEEGHDWILQDGSIVLTEGSRIFYWKKEQLYPETAKPGGTFAKTDGGHILFAEGHFFHDRQLAVTYTSQKGLWPGEIPAFAGDALPRTMQRLTNDKALRLVLFGDSISTGANASGVMGAPPYLPSFGVLLTKQLERQYGAKVEFFNPSVGGTDSFWGVREAEARVSVHNPDLVILGFGMNDHIPPEEFAANIAEIMEIVRRTSPHAECILISTSLPNPLAKGFTKRQHAYKEALEALCGKGVALCNIRDLQLTLQKRKRYIDLTGNHVNHPNDFFARIHGQALCALLIP